MNKIKILYVITALNVGGAEVNLYRLLSCFDHNKFELRVVSMLDKGLVGEMIEENLKIPVTALKITGKFKAISTMFEVGKMIKSWSPQIVHSHMVHANLFSRLIRLFFPFPVLICTIHNIDEKGKTKSARWRMLAYRLSDFLCDLTTQVSLAGLKKYKTMKVAPPDKIVFMPNGIDLDKFYLSSEDTNVLRRSLSLGTNFSFLAVGSLTLQKDYPNLLKAFLVLHRHKPNSLLLIAGDGPLRDELTKTVEELNLAEAILFLGFRTDIPALMKVVDAFVLSSAWEGMPVVLLEAAASYLPVIATDVGGNSEVVTDQISGFLVPPGNSQELAAAMLKLIKLPPEKLQEMGRKGFAKVKEKYSLEVVVSQWEDIYLLLLKQKETNA